VEARGKGGRETAEKERGEVVGGSGGELKV